MQDLTLASSSSTAPEELPGMGQTEDRATKIRKLAAFLIILGPELAADILKNFDQTDIRDISMEMAKMDLVDGATQRQILEEFSGIAAGAAISATGGSQFTRQVLEKSLGPFQANALLQNIAPSRSPEVDFSILQQLDGTQLLNVIKSEDPQTIAFILSYLDPTKCAEILALLNPEVRCEVVLRIATLESVPSDVLARVLNTLSKQIDMTRAISSKSGGPKSVADAINSMEMAMGRSLLTSLDETDPEISAAIKKILFIFEDLRKLDNNALQRLLREVETKDLVYAMKTASEPLRQALFNALPKRAAENIREEAKLTGAIRISEIEAAQQKIIEAMRKLEEQGEIIVGGGGKSDVVA